ncbi:hypothetical protein NM688_g5390 [Phlebia brevispora]|uniref:Uncharacterized protein n=1 Tax=Phlebia brevispora TaxID=194682 RepID=A0ACC1SW21_9APHY|nr:hypothetical protein NM688_g5390 [Phlebia brevispora]
MARQTRRSTRKNPTPSTSATPSTVVSPIFSTKSSVQSATPDTSDNDSNVVEKPKARTTRSTTAANKRKRSPSPEVKEVVTGPAPPRRKRRQGSQPYVDLPVLKAKSRTASKGKSRATSKARSETDEDEIPDSQDEELEYDEQASLDESDDSGSEFQISEDEDDYVEDSEDEDEITTTTKLRSFAEALEEEGIDADEVMMEVVIEQSLQSARAAQTGDLAGAGSSKAHPARNTAAASARRDSHASTAKDRRIVSIIC